MANDPAPAAPQPTAPEGPVADIDPLLAATLSPEALAHRKEQLADWGEWVAVQDIVHPPNVLAYAAGSPVPASNVAKWKYDEMGLVAKRSSKDGKLALADVAAKSPSAS
jgi:hypothetical protein